SFSSPATLLPLPSFPTLRSSDLDVILCLLWAEVLAAFLQHNRQLQLVVKLLGQMLGIDYRLVVANDGVDVLEKDNPRHDRMRKSDRKSTRLNSSHVAISYAVFCL